MTTDSSEPRVWMDDEGATRTGDAATLLFLVTRGGDVTHIVAARDHVHALVLCAESGEFDAHPYSDDITVAVIEPDSACARSSFFDEDSGWRGALWDYYLKDPSPGVLGSSEF